MNRFSRLFFLALVSVFVFVAGAAAQAQETQVPDKVTVELGIGLGWHLCDEREELPPLEEAMMCSGVVGNPVMMKLELKRRPAAKPEWLLWDTKYTDEIVYESEGITSKLEVLVSLAKVDGITWAFLEGRVWSEQGAIKVKPAYFRISVQGGFEKLNDTWHYGAEMIVPWKGYKLGYAPYVAFAPKRTAGVPPTLR